MKTLYLDCFSGISGDMLLGALVDVGVDEDALISELAKLNVEGYKLSFEKKAKQGIGGTDAHVDLFDHHMMEHDHDHHHDEDHHHEHDHHHGEDNHHGNEDEHHHVHNDEHHHIHDDEHFHGQDEHSHGEDEPHHHHLSRNFSDIQHIIDSSGISDRVKELSKKIFYEIAVAEAKVHMKPVEEVHFHEVGAIDSIVDIVGVCICLDMLGVEKVCASELHDGKGFIQCQHGTIPVPVPAVMEMLRGSGIPLVQENIETELVTPTGFAIAKCVAAAFGKVPVMNVQRVGYGFGKRETGGFNAIRVLLGETEEKQGLESLVVLETNIDNLSGEILGYSMEKLLNEGALDVFHTPIYMKKNRPAVMLSVITKADMEQKLVDILLKETTTLGIRRYEISRYAMEREIFSVNTKYGEVRLKKAWLGSVVKYSPEYEDCAQIAREHNVPIKDVFAAAMAEAENR
jgi:uncharacterized protein (TIGR00299 family) protein